MPIKKNAPRKPMPKKTRSDTYGENVVKEPKLQEGKLYTEFDIAIIKDNAFIAGANQTKTDEVTLWSHAYFIAWAHALCLGLIVWAFFVWGN